MKLLWELINGLRENGIKVPEDVNVMGFDDNLLHQYSILN